VLKLNPINIAICLSQNHTDFDLIASLIFRAVVKDFTWIIYKKQDAMQRIFLYIKILIFCKLPDNRGDGGQPGSFGGRSSDGQSFFAGFQSRILTGFFL